MAEVLVLNCELRVPSYTRTDTSCDSEYCTKANTQINSEAFLQRHQVFTFGLERLHITTDVFTLPLVSSLLKDRTNR